MKTIISFLVLLLVSTITLAQDNWDITTKFNVPQNGIVNKGDEVILADVEISPHTREYWDVRAFTLKFFDIKSLKNFENFRVVLNGQTPLINLNQGNDYVLLQITKQIPGGPATSKLQIFATLALDSNLTDLELANFLSLQKQGGNPPFSRKDTLLLNFTKEQNSVGISDLKKTEGLICQDRNRRIITLKNFSLDEQVIVTDMIGRTIFKVEVGPELITTIDLSNEPVGIFIITIGHNRIIRKIML